MKRPIAVTIELGTILFWALSASVALAAPPPNDDCSAAIAVGTGGWNGTLSEASQDGAASVGQPGEPDVWFLFSTAVGGSLAVKTCGTNDLGGQDLGFDTVLSIHAGCPGTTQNELAANDDWPSGPLPLACSGSDSGAPRDSAVSLALSAGQTVLIRVSRFASANAVAFVLNVSFQPAGPPLHLSSFAPVEVSYLGKTPFVVRGQGFTPQTSLLLQSASNPQQSLSASFIDGTRLIGIVPPDAGSIVPPASPAAGLMASDPSSGADALANAFSFIGPLSVVSMEPSLLLPQQSATVTITGVGFTPETIVTVGGAQLSNSVFVDARTIRGVAPALPAGTYAVSASDTLFTPNGSIPVRYDVPGLIRYSALPNRLILGAYLLLVDSYETYAWDSAQNAYVGAAGAAATSASCGGAATGPIRVHFDGLTIELTGDPAVGKVKAGAAVYPASPTSPDPLELSIEGLKVRFESLRLEPASATGHAVLVLTPALTDPATCRPVEIDLGMVLLDPSDLCKHFSNRPAEAFGPWRLDPTGIAVSGTGLVIDLSTTESAPPDAPGWRGVILRSGSSAAVPGPESIVSNTGYLQAGYDFANGRLDATGLSLTLRLSAPFDFEALEPQGYQIHLLSGSIAIGGGGFLGGEFKDGTVRMPKAAAINIAGGQLIARFSTLQVQKDYDLRGEATVADDFFWGELTRAPDTVKAYAAQRAAGAGRYAGYLYFAASPRATYRPLDGAGAFKEPDFGLGVPARLDKIEDQGMQGFTTLFDLSDSSGSRLIAFTPDVPDASHPIDGELYLSWLNVEARGVHASIGVLSLADIPLQLGPTPSAGYAADPDGKKEPFATTLLPKGLAREIARIQSVDSAVVRSAAQGIARLEGGIAADIPFKDLQLTSTAHLPGAKIDLSTPIKIKESGVELVEKPGATAGAGVLSVKTGQILLTAAGLREKRHFEQAFWLTWGELHPTGLWGRLVFDRNSAGQKFDGFTFTPELVRIGHDPESTAVTASYLGVTGQIGFDFFPGRYLNILDYYDLAPGAPWNNRRIVLGSESGGLGIRPSETHLERKWDGEFGDLAFDIHYDDKDQDGFVGTGTTELSFVHGDLASSIDLNRKSICLSVDETSSRDFDIVIVNFGAMGRTTGCGCIIDGSLRQLILQSSLDAAAGASVTLRTATHMALEFIVRPSTTEMTANGELFLNALSGVAGDIEVTGQARFLVNREEDFADGEIEGRIKTGGLLGGANLGGTGKLNWHVGKAALWLQGRIGVEILSSSAGLGIEGGFFVGSNCPSAKAWVINEENPRYRLDVLKLPTLTGVYGYAQYGASVNLFVLSGGYDVFAGVGSFVGTLPGSLPAKGIPLPNVVGHVGVHAWGKILGGVASADGWAHLQLKVPDLRFQGELGLEGCFLKFCKTVTLQCELDTSGFSIE